MLPIYLRGSKNQTVTFLYNIAAALNSKDLIPQAICEVGIKQICL